MDRSSRHKKTPARPGTEVSGVNTLEVIHVEKNSTAVVPFKFEDRQVRTMLIEGEPWFVAADVCSVLGYANSRKAVQDNCREAGVTASDISSGGQKRRITLISEGNLYRLIIKSRKEEAQRFEAWVCDEVLPSIRKTGRYEDSNRSMPTLIGTTIGTNGFQCLAGVLDGKVRQLPSRDRRAAKNHIWSQVHKAFSVVSADQIPADQMDSARNFIGAYVLEGVFLPKQEETLTDRVMIGRDHLGRETRQPIPDGAYILTKEEFARGVFETFDVPTSLDEMLGMLVSGIQMARKRAAAQTYQLDQVRKGGFAA